MTDIGPPHPGESDSDYLKRMAKVAEERKRRARDEAIQKRLDAAAEAEREFQDVEELDEITRHLYGTSLSELRGELDYMEDDKAKKMIRDAMTAADRNNPQKAKKIIKQNKSRIRTAHKQAKAKKRKEGGCLSAFAALTALATGTAWAIYELATEVWL